MIRTLKRVFARPIRLRKSQPLALQIEQEHFAELGLIMKQAEKHHKERKQQ